MEWHLHGDPPARTASRGRPPVRRTLQLILLNALTLASTACLGAGEVEEDEILEEGELYSSDGPGSYLGATVLQYEGSCSFLLNCSSYSRSAGVVTWGCGGTGCSMTDRFVAVPNWRDGMCGEEVTICRGEVCTTAEVKDVSCCNRWEASHQVLKDLGIDHASNSNTCTGHGEGRVEIYRGGSGVPGDAHLGGEFNGTYCAEPSTSCGGNQPCWATCPAGSLCDFAQGTWGYCRDAT